MDRYNFAYKTLTSIVKSATYKPWEVNSQKVMNIITPIYKQWKTIFKEMKKLPSFENLLIVKTRVKF